MIDHETARLRHRDNLIHGLTQSIFDEDNKTDEIIALTLQLVEHHAVDPGITNVIMAACGRIQEDLGPFDTMTFCQYARKQVPKNTAAYHALSNRLSEIRDEEAAKQKPRHRHAAFELHA